MQLAHCTVVRMKTPVAMPEGLVDDAGHAALVEALDVLGPGGIDVERPYFALSGTACFIKRHFALPDAEDLTRDHLTWEAEQLLGADVGDYVVETLITPRCGFLIAVRRQILELYGVLCRHAGLGEPGFDMTSFALCNALEHCGQGGAGAEIILQQDSAIARAVLLRDGVYEGEQAWAQDEQSVDQAMARFTATWLTDDDAAPRLWLAGGIESDDWQEFEHVAQLDPFVGLDVSDSARLVLQSADGGAGMFSVALGLAVRGLADV